MRFKVLGSILMILGTSLGAGMLALPVVAAHQSFFSTSVMLLLAWFVMTVGAFSLLEVSLWFPPGANLITLSRATLGRIGQGFVWFLYLALLYALITSYLSAAGDVLTGLLALLHCQCPLWLGDCLALLLLGSVVLIGINSVDLVNRFLMLFKMSAYLVVVGLMFPHVHVNAFHASVSGWSWSALMVMLTAFGFAIIIPSIRGYLGAGGKLRSIVLIGTVLPLFIYLVWVFVVEGVLGSPTLLSLYGSAQQNTALIAQFKLVIKVSWITAILHGFVTVCVMTSFLGVSVCLIDFLADGLSLKKTGKQGALVFTGAYLPPLLIVLVGSSVFTQALQYAGIFCMLLLVILPLLMLYCGRYRRQLATERVLPIGSFLIQLLLLLAFALLLYLLYETFVGI